MRDWLRAWIAGGIPGDSGDGDPGDPGARIPGDRLDSLRGVLWHLSDAWARRHEPNVVLVHFDDLAADLHGEMRRLAGRFDIEVPAPAWPGLVHAAGFDQMRARAPELAPDAAAVLRDPRRFFRRGTSGAGREVLTAGDLARYEARAAQLAPGALLDWLHRR